MKRRSLQVLSPHLGLPNLPSAHTVERTLPPSRNIGQLGPEDPQELLELQAGQHLLHCLSRTHSNQSDIAEIVGWPERNVFCRGGSYQFVRLNYLQSSR